MAKSLFLDCSNGASGDMIVAALLDAGASEERLRAVLASLSMAGEFEVRVGRRAVAALDACDFDVVLAAGDNHDHDMAYLHGGPVGGNAVAAEAAERHHLHDHDHDHDHDHVGAGRHHDHVGDGHHHGPHAHGNHHPHVHRGLAEVRAIVDAADMTEGARRLAHLAFEVLAAAEAAAHGTTPDQVHFHEVGAVDSIVDFIAAAVLLDDLAPARVYATPLPDGRGTVRCQHGVIPVPVPAVVNICRQQGLPMAHVDVAGELVTPTGAALLAAFGARFVLPASYRIECVGLGAGKRDYGIPSLVRAMLIEVDADPAPKDPSAATSVPADYIYKLECDIDDASSEVLAYAAERLADAGAREVHWLPIFTKKGRPAYQLQVIAAPEDVERLQDMIFAETTTIGIRRQRMERTVLPREERTCRTEYGPVRVKTVTLPDGTSRSKPEYDDLAAIARRAGLPLARIAVLLGDRLV